MKRRSVTVFLVALALATLTGVSALAFQSKTSKEWTGLREGVLHFRVSELSEIATGSVRLTWTPAWIAESQRERLYWYGPQGDLITRIEIDFQEIRGSVELPFAGGAGDYRLVIPGYSFRRYAAAFGVNVKSVLEPAKIHRSLDAPSFDRLWLGPSNKATQLHLKSYGGRARLSISDDPTNSKRQTLEHRETTSYQDSATLYLPPSSTARELEIQNGGRIALWVDGAPNYFALSRKDLFVPTFKPGAASFKISNETTGPTTRVGNYAEFTQPRPELRTLFKSIQPDQIQSYIFEDSLAKNPSDDGPIISALSQINHARIFGLLSRTERDSVPPDTSKSSEFIAKYLATRKAEKLDLETIAFVDEPNLRYRNYSDFEKYFVSLATTTRQISGSLGLNVKIAAPESSRMVNGPTNEPRRTQSGFSWTKSLLEDHWDLVDVISWHMWQNRALEATDQFAETINDVAELNEAIAKSKHAEPKELAISQTNLGSGPNLSPYQQDTAYAGLWWASVVAQSIATTKLDTLMWFKAVDFGPYTKGLMVIDGKTLKPKPVADAMIFIRNALKPHVVSASSSSHEVDLVAMTDDEGNLSALCVNKSNRPYTINLEAPAWRFLSVRIWRDTNSTTQANLQNDPSGAPGPVTIPPQSICQITATRPAPSGD